MPSITSSSKAEILFQLNWSSDMAQHTDVLAAPQVDFWRDLLPADMAAELQGKQMGDQVQSRMDLVNGSRLVAPTDIRQFSRDRFHPDRRRHGDLVPRNGRFYPKGLLKDLPGVFSANIEPFRCVAVNNGRIKVDLGHPLAGRRVTVTATVGKIDDGGQQRGGNLHHWWEELARGPGMQARWQHQPTDFTEPDAFNRIDESSDGRFYTRPRLVQHIDDAAINVIAQLYDRFVSDGMRVLDLMSSWQSYLPEHASPSEVVGIGLNAEEMSANRRLSRHLVHDLNRDPHLPFDDGTFDAVVCTVSVEYLTRPFEVFDQVARVLKPGGVFAVTFSDRWFETKTIHIWPRLHPFERMGLVMDYFGRSRAFEGLQTYSLRGLERPRHDKYFPEKRTADPVFAVWARRRQQ